MHTVKSGRLALTYNGDFSGEAYLYFEGSNARLEIPGTEVLGLIKQLTEKHLEVRPDLLLLIGTYPDDGKDVIIGVYHTVEGARVGQHKHEFDHGELLMSYRIDAWAPED